jgi:Phage tail lysozyme/D-alanyl-D-alanine carboxypeptidase
VASGDSKVVDLADLNPEFQRRMGNFLTSAKAAGIPAHIIEAYRSNAVQAQYYKEKQQGLRPYPVAPPGASFHNYGYAADTLADDRSRQQDLINYAYAHPEFGIAPLPKDPPHFQIAGYQHVSDLLANPPKLGEGPRPDLSPFIATRQGYSIAPGGAAATPSSGGAADAPSTGGVDIRNSIYQMLIGKGLTANQAMGVVYSMMGESGAGLDAGSLGDSGSSIGFGQWNGERRANLEATAKTMGVAPTDPSAQLAHFKNEIDGPYAAEIENIKKNASSAADATRLWTGSVGEKSGYERPKVNNWQQRFAVGSQAGKIGDDGAPVWTTPSTQPTGSKPSTTGAPPAPTTDTPAPGPPTSVGDAITRLTREDAKGTSPLDKLGAAFAPKQAQLGMGNEPMLQAPMDSSSSLFAPAQQLMATNMATMKPPSWSTSPYGFGTAGPQISELAAAAGGQFGARPPGLTLNSLSPFGYG